jgi:hypothetical protein
MAVGVIFSLAVGFGLMALIFYSSREGYDQPPVLIVSKDESVESENAPETGEPRQSGRSAQENAMPVCGASVREPQIPQSARSEGH